MERTGKRGAGKAGAGPKSPQPKVVDTDAGDDTGADKDFEARLDGLELRPGKSAAAVAREHGLDLQRLYVLVFYARLWKFDDAYEAARIAVFPHASKWLRNAAEALRFLATVHLPCFEDMEGASARHHARYAGASPSELRRPLSHRLEGLGPLAEWQMYKRFPMPMEEIQLSDGKVLRLPLEPIWLPPFHLPAGLLRAFDGATSGPEPPGVADWTRCAIAEAKDFEAIADLLKQLASQADQIHATIFRRGRRVEHDKKAFRRRFAEYAVACSGQKLDDLGATLYSMVFGEIDAQEYARLRRRDEGEQSAAPRAGPRRRTK